MSDTDIIHRPLRILHLEDNPSDAELVSLTLQASGLACTIKHVQTREEFEGVLDHEKVDLVLSDFSLPTFNGLTALELVRREHPDLPFILVSGTIEEREAIESLKAGATDYLLKHHPQRLAEAVRRAMRDASRQAKRREADQRIRELAALLEQTQDAIYVRDLDQHITYWNRGAERLYGWAAADVVGRLANELLYQTDTPQLQEIRRIVLEKGEWMGELKQYTRTGRELIVMARRNLLRDEQGRPVSILNINTDITEKKQIESQFLRAQRMEGMGTLAGGIAHDFNNILSSIFGYTDLARMELETSPAMAQEHLDAVMTAATRARDLVRQILTFSRKQEEVRTLQPLQPIVEEALKLLRASLPASVRIKTQFDATAPPVMANATQIHQAMMNLGINAAHAMEPGGGLLHITLDQTVVDGSAAPAKEELPPGRYVRLTVSDTGCGMDEATQERLFEPFFTTKEPGKGSGLGLAVVYGIMKSHEGAVIVQSQRGEGATFQLYFPARQGEVAEARTSPTPVPRGNGELILFVDDERPLAVLGKQVLENLGYRVIAETSTVFALDIFQGDPARFAAVITNMIMPTMTGLELARELHRAKPGIPIILTTGYGSGLDEAELRRDGIARLLSKPCSTETLARVVHEVLEARKRT